MTIQEEVLEWVKNHDLGKEGPTEYRFLCPLHPDTRENPNATYNPKKESWFCQRCNEGGGYLSLAKHAGIEIPTPREKAEKANFIDSYEYQDADGTVLYRKERFSVPPPKMKTFAISHLKNGRWERGQGGHASILYRLPELASLPPHSLVLIPEGEKDVEAARKLGFNATTNPGGAGEKGKWLKDFNRYFTGHDVVIIPDNDAVGKAHAINIAKNVAPVAWSVRVLTLPGVLQKGDLSDWIQMGGDRDELLALIDRTEAWNLEPDDPDAKIDLSQFQRTQTGNAEIIAHLYGRDLRFDRKRETWRYWNGTYWVEDAEAFLIRAAISVARARKKGAELIESADLRAAEMRWAQSSESLGQLTAMTTVAKALHPIDDSGAGWNANPYLIGFSNGTVNLATGEFYEGRREDKISMSVGLPYEPDAECPRWLQFLEEIFPNHPELADWIQTAVGYSITGSTQEQVWFLLYGKGSNGKSTFLEVITEALGDYSYTMNFSTIEKGKEQSIATDMAALAGKRFVYASEASEHSRINEGRVKSLTGGDQITARELYKKEFTYQPELKLWIGVNHKPAVEDDSEGFWRRVLLVPFLAHFDVATRDNNLKRDLKRELPGILSWAVEGATRWHQNGLSIPPIIAAATVDFRGESDRLADFIAQCCVLHPNAKVGASALYMTYREWAEKNGKAGREVLSSTAFGRLAVDRWQRWKNRLGAMMYGGIGLKDDSASWGGDGDDGGFDPVSRNFSEKNQDKKFEKVLGTEGQPSVVSVILPCLCLGRHEGKTNLCAGADWWQDTDVDDEDTWHCSVCHNIPE